MKLKNPFSRLKGIKVRKQPEIAVFFWCFLIATLFWFLQAMNEMYTSRIVLQVDYHNIPHNRTFTRPPPEDLNLTVYASGWDLFGYHIRRRNFMLQLDMERMQNLPYIIPIRQRELLATALPYEIQVTDIFPDTIFFFMERLATRTLPIAIVTDEEFARNHGLSASIEIEPDTIVISGAQSVIDQIDTIYTQPIPLENITEPFTTIIPLVRPPNVRLGRPEVAVHLPVERLTEGRHEIPVSIINMYESMEIILVPERVTIVYQTALSNFAEITPDMFEVVIDAERIDPETNRQVRVNLRSSPPYVYNIRIIPEYIDYIIIR